MPTAEFASLVYGPGGVPLDDCVEAFHEASRLYPNLAPRRLASLVELARSPELQTTVARAGRVHDHRPGIDLPAVPLRAIIDDDGQPTCVPSCAYATPTMLSTSADTSANRTCGSAPHNSMICAFTSGVKNARAAGSDSHT